eukprot:Hpha_TRINITY_DN11286_c0_g1::TRINITY_DN11286_c0_g1_i2::g.167584::m.167584
MLENEIPSTVVKVPVSLVAVDRETPLDLGLSLEPLEQLRQLEQSGARQRQEEARGVTWSGLATRLGRDLSEFLSTVVARCGYPQPPGMVVVPAGAVQQWLRRVTTKFQRDQSWWAAISPG